MDLCTDVPELIVIMDHTTREGELKLPNAPPLALAPDLHEMDLNAAVPVSA